MKTVSSSTPAVRSLVPEPADATLDGAGGIPVARALAAVGEPDSTFELGQRLAPTVAMLWSDVTGVDLFLPDARTGELRGVRDPRGGADLLGAVASPCDDHSAVRVIPATASLVAGAPGRGAAMSAPVLLAGEGQGFIIVQRRAAAADFGPRDLEALGHLACGVGELLPRARARGAWRQRDMASAREMQRRFLPSPLESNSAGVRVLAEYRPAFDVGGDFYDFVDLGNGRVLAAIGDVAGKGVTAALMMSRISSELRRLAAGTASPAELLTRLNEALSGGIQDDRFVTVVCVLLDLPQRRWVVCNAGHVVPVVRRRSGVVTGLGYGSGPPIGMLPDTCYEDEVVPAEPRDILVLATDGVFDTVAGTRRPCSTMGRCKLIEVIGKAPHDLAEIHRRILDAAASEPAGRDDLALLGLELAE
jgi:hypothetical protein